MLNINDLMGFFAGRSRPGKVSLVSKFAVQGDKDRLAGKMVDYMGESKSKNTRLKYKGAYNGFAEFCRANGLESCPASEYDVGLYLTSQLDLGCSAAKVTSIIYAVKFNNELNGSDLDAK